MQFFKAKIKVNVNLVISENLRISLVLAEKKILAAKTAIFNVNWFVVNTNDTVLPKIVYSIASLCEFSKNM